MTPHKRALSALSLISVLLGLGLLVVAQFLNLAQAQQDQGKIARILEINGPIGPPIPDYITASIAGAQRAGVDRLLVEPVPPGCPPPHSHPITQVEPAEPRKLVAPAIDMKRAAAIQSAAVAAPFAIAGTPRPATQKPPVSRTRLRQPMYRYMTKVIVTNTNVNMRV